MSNETSEVNKETKNLCKRGCGFYGSVQFKDMCSKCYQADVARSTSIDLTGSRTSCLDCTDSSISVISARVAVRPESCPTSQVFCGTKRKADDAIHEPKAECATSSIRVNRCSWCRKRVGLTGFFCRCEKQFCSLHRYSDKHECTYDYRTNGRIAIARANPEVRCPKIRKL